MFSIDLFCNKASAPLLLVDTFREMYLLKAQEVDMNVAEWLLHRH